MLSLFIFGEAIRYAMHWGEFVGKRWEGKLLAPLLAIGASFYNLVITARNLAFDYGILTSHHVSVPVIALGNLTTGGTGKTPAAIWLVQQIQQVSRRQPVLISRGYGQDESRLFAQKLPYIPHYIHHKRTIAAQKAISELGENIVLILDDGFQHRYLARNANIILIDATCPFGWNAPLPAGLLRETASSLRRADWVMITRSDQVTAQQLTAIQTRISQYKPVPQLLASHAPVCVRRLTKTTTTQLPSQTHNSSSHPLSSNHLVDASQLETNDCYSLNHLVTTTLLPVAGIANPESFYASLQKLSYHLLPMLTFSDHHSYTQQDVDNIILQAKKLNAQGIITTAKDAVKLENYLPALLPIWVLEIEFQVHDTEQRFATWLKEILG